MCTPKGVSNESCLPADTRLSCRVDMIRNYCFSSCKGMRIGGAMQWNGLAAAWQSHARNALQVHNQLSTAMQTISGDIGTA